MQPLFLVEIERFVYSQGGDVVGIGSRLEVEIDDDRRRGYRRIEVNVQAKRWIEVAE